MRFEGQLLRLFKAVIKSNFSKNSVASDLNISGAGAIEVS
jgi:hypothetical protein